jgi:hypothetical protein
MNKACQIEVDHCTPDEAVESCKPASEVRLKIRAVCGAITPDNFATMQYDFPAHFFANDLKPRPSIGPELKDPEEIED